MLALTMGSRTNHNKLAICREKRSYRKEEARDPVNRQRFGAIVSSCEHVA